MRTTLDLDRRLFAEAAKITGLKEKTAVIHAGLRLILEQEAGRRLIALGGTMPDAWAAPRRRDVKAKPSPRRRRKAV
ncbi:MAG: type II toxin-antitoxin system VapB family antitoxin [Phycisphaerales bacterium]